MFGPKITSKYQVRIIKEGRIKILVIHRGASEDLTPYVVLFTEFKKKIMVIHRRVLED